MLLLFLYFLKSLAIRTEVRGKQPLQILVAQLHVLAGDGDEVEAVLLVQLLQANPVFLVDGAVAQVGDGALGVGSRIDLGEPAALLGDDGLIVAEDDHDELLERREILGVSFVLLRALVVDVSEKVGVGQVVLVVGWVAVVLGGDEAALHEVGPHGAALEQGVGALADPIGRGRTLLELGDPVVLAAERDQAADGRGPGAAALDVAAQELPSLAEPNGVDCGRGA